MLKKATTKIDGSSRREAGHFLTGYLLGVLPKAYHLPLPGKDNLGERLRAGGAVKLVRFKFLREVPDGKMSTE
ncbi:hypothetical protein MLD38_039153 [Melastoma candidum]|uniref:Uncharacterized protein n=1 Tax=Melastoma candidum TaxID=119954 RepID=A0ACB9L285_9MYRT|nr:hypothetical protein MLD38_039153 [Melastoma candidum]